MIIKLSSEMIGEDSIKYHLFVESRQNEGFGQLKKYLGDNRFLLDNLKMDENEGIAEIQSFFPNGYCNWPNNPRGVDERLMRKGLGSIMLAKMIEDAEEIFCSKVIVVFRPSYSAEMFFRKKNFVRRGCLYYPLAPKLSPVEALRS